MLTDKLGIQNDPKSSVTTLLCLFTRGLLESLQRLQPLGQSGMRMVVCRVPVEADLVFVIDVKAQKRHLQPVYPDCGQVLHVQLHERAPKTVTHVTHFLGLEFVLQFCRELVSLVLVAPADGIHCNANNGLKRRQNHLEVNKLVRGQRPLQHDTEMNCNYLEEQESENGGRFCSDFLGEIE